MIKPITRPMFVVIRFIVDVVANLSARMLTPSCDNRMNVGDGCLRYQCGRFAHIRHAGVKPSAGICDGMIVRTVPDRRVERSDDWSGDRSAQSLVATLTARAGRI